MVATYQDDTDTQTPDSSSFKVDPLSLYPSAADQGKQLEQTAGGAQALVDKSKDYASGTAPTSFAPQPLGAALGGALASNPVTGSGNGAPNQPQNPVWQAPTETTGVTQPGTPLGQLQAERYNPNDPTAGNVAPDAAQKLGGAAATALPMVAFGPAASAASMGAQGATEAAGAPKIVQDIAGLAPYMAGGIPANGLLKTGAETIGAGAGQYAGNQVDKALNLPDIPIVGGPGGFVGMMAGGMAGGAGAEAAGAAVDRMGNAAVPDFTPRAPAWGQADEAHMQRTLVGVGGGDFSPREMFDLAAHQRAEAERVAAEQAPAQPPADDDFIARMQASIDAAQQARAAGGRVQDAARAAEGAVRPEGAQDVASRNPYALGGGLPNGDTYYNNPAVPPELRQGSPAEAGAVGPEEAANSPPVAAPTSSGAPSSAPTTLAPNEVGSISEASSPPPSGRYNEFGDWVTPDQEATGKYPASLTDKATGERPPEPTDAEVQANLAKPKEGFAPPTGSTAPALTPDEAAAKVGAGGPNFGAQKALSTGNPAAMPAGATVTPPGGAPPSGGQGAGGAGGAGAGGNNATGAGSPLGANRPAAVPANLWNHVASVVSMPLQTMVGVGGHFLRQGTTVAATHLGEFVNGMRAFGLMMTDPVKGRAFLQTVQSLPYVAARADKRGIYDLLPENNGPRTVHDATPKGAWLGRDSAKGAPIGDIIRNRIPVAGEIINRFGAAGSAYLTTLRDTTYNTLAQNMERRLPNAEDNMYKDLAYNLSHATGHSTPLEVKSIAGHDLPGAIADKSVNLGQASTSRTLGIGPGAVVARVQHMMDIATKSGAPVPWADGARSEWTKQMLALGAMTGTTAAIGHFLGATVPTPWNTDMMNPLSGKINSSIGKAITYNPLGTAKTEYDAGSGYDTTMRLFGNVGAALISGNRDSIFDHSGGGLITQWLRGEMGPVPSWSLDMALGKDWRDDPYGPRGGQEGMDNLMKDVHAGFVTKWAPLAAQSMYNAWNAYGPSGLLRAAPAMGAFQADTYPVSPGEQAYNLHNDAAGEVLSDYDKRQQAFGDPVIANALDGAKWDDLLPNEKKQVLATGGPDIQAKVEAQAEAARAAGDPFQQISDITEGSNSARDAITRQFAPAGERLQQQLQDGKTDPQEVRKQITAMSGAYFDALSRVTDEERKAKAELQSSDAYTKATGGGGTPKTKNEVQQAYDDYLNLTPFVHNDGTKDMAEYKQKQQAIIDRLSAPADKARLQAAVTREDTRPDVLKFYEDTVAPVRDEYFNLPTTAAKQAWDVANPSKEAVLAASGYRGGYPLTVHSQDAADAVHAMNPKAPVRVLR